MSYYILVCQIIYEVQTIIMTTFLVGIFYANFEWIIVKLHFNMSRYVMLELVEEQSGEAVNET